MQKTEMKQYIIRDKEKNNNASYLIVNFTSEVVINPVQQM